MKADLNVGGTDPIELRKKIFRINRLSSMPQVVMELLGAVENDLTGARKLERIIESDQALTSRVLGLANSAYYGCCQAITTIQRAVVVIGFDELRLLAIGTGLSDMLDMSKKTSLFTGRELWSHCLAVSWLAKNLAREAGYENPGEVMLSGLLHDVGKLVMLSQMEEESEVLARMMAEGLKYYQAEEALGVKHTTIGFWLTKKWGLPEIHISSIHHHHAPAKDEFHFKTTNLVCLADLLAKEMHFGLVQESRPLELLEIIQGAELSSDRISLVMTKAGRKIPRLLDSWHLSP